MARYSRRLGRTAEKSLGSFSPIFIYILYIYIYIYVDGGAGGEGCRKEKIKYCKPFIFYFVSLRCFFLLLYVVFDSPCARKNSYG